MRLPSRQVARLLKLPQASTYAVDIEKNIAIPMRDGVVLLVDQLRMANKGVL